MNGSRRGDQTPQMRLAELQLENSRLRQLVTDLLLKKIELEETLQGGHRNAVLTGIRASQIDFLKEDPGQRSGRLREAGHDQVNESLADSQLRLI